MYDRDNTGLVPVEVALDINRSWFRTTILVLVLSGLVGFGVGFGLSSAKQGNSVLAPSVQKVETYTDGYNSQLFVAVAYQSFDSKPFIKIQSKSKSTLIFVTQKGVQNFYLPPGGTTMIPKFETFDVIEVKS
jgi:hypothetical protein